MEAANFDRVDGDFTYLLNMQMNSLTRKKKEVLERERQALEDDIATLAGRSVEALWLEELDNLERDYLAHKRRRAISNNAVAVQATAAGGKKSLIKKKKTI